MLDGCRRCREELRTQFHNQLELEADVDRHAQVRLKGEMADRQRQVDAHYHDLLMADVEQRMRREERETIERNRANHVQVQALVEQIATAEDSKAIRAKRVAEEQQYLVSCRSMLLRCYYAGHSCSKHIKFILSSRKK